MPKVENRPRKISKRHFIGMRQGGGISVISPQSITSRNTFDLATHLRSKRKQISPVVYGIERYKTTDPYSPAVAPGSFVTMNYNTQVIKSKDLFIYADTTGKFYPKKKGTWQITATLLATPNSAVTLAWTSHELHLYKNGAFYSILDANTLVTTFGIVQNYYDNYDMLQGTDVIHFDTNDYFEIKYSFSGAAPMGVGDTLGGYLTIEYLTNQTELI